MATAISRKNNGKSCCHNAAAAAATSAAAAATPVTTTFRSQSREPIFYREKNISTNIFVSIPILLV